MIEKQQTDIRNEQTIRMEEEVQLLRPRIEEKPRIGKLWI